jgi:hypothetical protein
VGQPSGGGTVGWIVATGKAVACFSGKGTGVPNGDVCSPLAASSEGGGAKGEVKSFHPPRLGSAPLTKPVVMVATINTSAINRNRIDLLCFIFCSFRFGYAPFGPNVLIMLMRLSLLLGGYYDDASYPPLEHHFQNHR